MKKLRVMVLLHEDLIPPEDPGDADLRTVEWKTEYNVVSTLRSIGHEVLPLGVRSDLEVIRKTIDEWNPHIAFNLLEEFDGVAVYDQNVIGYLELLGLPYTGCNPRGLMLARDKSLCKKVLAYHRIPSPEFIFFPIGRPNRRIKRVSFPLIVKSVSQEAGLGVGVTMLGSLAIPLQRFGVVAGNAFAIVVHDGKFTLGCGVTLLGGLAIPCHRLGFVPRNAQAMLVHEAEVVLGFGAAPLGQRQG